MGTVEDRTLGHTASFGTSSPKNVRYPRLVLVLEAGRPQASSASVSLRDLEELTIGRGGERALVSKEPWRLTVPDRWLSSTHARIERSFHRWILLDAESKNGSFVNQKKVTRQTLVDGDVIELGSSFFVFRDAVDDGTERYLDLQGADQAPLSLNPAFVAELDKLDTLARTSVSVLLLGESGTGKDVFAQRIHAQSQRSGNFVPVNCGALPEGLVESELFGHKKGAFSGATTDHGGLVLGANQGTLFLDEIADLPNRAQATLLRVLQDRTVRAVGALHSQEVDLRIVSATHFDLAKRVEDGLFRHDLYARIANHQTTLPPLRDRLEDLGLLIAGFLRDSNGETVQFSKEAARALLGYRWPLNVRELRSLLSTATALAADGVIDVAHLPAAIAEAPQGFGKYNDVAKKAQIEALLREHGGNVSAVARAMGKDRKQLQRWIARFRIDVDSFR